MDNEVSKLNNNRQIKQSNNLCNARYKLTVYEQRMVIAICSQIDDRKGELPIVKVKAKDLADFCGFDPSKKYTMVKTTARTLRSRTLEYQMPNGDWYITGWINSAFYDSKDGTITFTFDERLKPDLLNLKSAYLLTPAEPLMKFDRDYSVRLYFILKKMLKIRDFEKDLDFFRDRFQLSKSYEIFFNLKNKVIEPAIAEINAKSDIRVWHEYIKKGRIYTKIHFIVNLKKNDKKEIAPPAEKQAEQAPPPTSMSAVTPGIRLMQAIGLNPPPSVIKRAMEKATEPAEPTLNIDDNMSMRQIQPQPPKETVASSLNEKKNWSDQQQADYDLMLQHGVWAQVAQQIVATYDHARIERSIKGVLQTSPKGNIRDKGAVIAHAITNDTYMGEAEERAKLRERAEERKIAEAIKAKKEMIKNNARREKNAIRNEELAKIRENKSKKELVETFEKVLVEYKNNNEILTEEMRAKLAANGIPETDFSLYQSATMRNLIKYIK